MSLHNRAYLWAFMQKEFGIWKQREQKKKQRKFGLSSLILCTLTTMKISLRRELLSKSALIRLLVGSLILGLININRILTAINWENCEELTPIDHDTLHQELTTAQRIQLTNKPGDLSGSLYSGLQHHWDTCVPRSQSGCAYKFNPESNRHSQYFEQLFLYYRSTKSTFCKHKTLVGRNGDGGKWICDFKPRSPCVVYSFGSFEDFSFEADMKTFDCEVHTFDCFVKGLNTPEDIGFHGWCVSNETTRDKAGRQFHDVVTIMDKLEHSALDIMKIDIEGYEYRVVESLKNLDRSKLPRQILIETHMTEIPNSNGYVSFQEYDAFWNTLHGLGYRPFSHEVNPLCHCCSEFSLMLIAS